MAPWAPIDRWRRACGIPTQRAPQSALSLMGGGLRLPQTAECLRQLARRRLTRGAPAAIGAQAPPGRWREAWPFGALDVLEALWQRLGSAEGSAQPRAAPTVDGAVARALWARGANRAWALRAPGTSRGCGTMGAWTAPRRSPGTIAAAP